VHKNICMKTLKELNNFKNNRNCIILRKFNSEPRAIACESLVYAFLSNSFFYLNDLRHSPRSR